MRRNRTMRLASLLLVLVLLTSCFVGNTFAKYVTAGTGTDSARVAKWGVAVEANADLFNTTYATDDEAVASVIANSVVSTENVVAPGTSGTLAGVSISGTPEVAVNVKYEADLVLEGWSFKLGYYSWAGWKTPDGWNVAPGSSPDNTHYRGSLMQETQGVRRPTTAPADPSVKQDVIVDTAIPRNAKVYDEATGTWISQDYYANKVYTWNPLAPDATFNTNVLYGSYCPLVITVGTTAISGLDYATLAEFEAAVEAAVAAYSANYEAGTDLSTITVPVSWAWAFEGNDVSDTALGNMAANGNASTVALTVTVTVTQID